MILAIDVCYHDHGATVAGLAFSDWSDTAASASATYLSHVHDVAPYQSGQFYQRELPCILQLLHEHQLRPQLIILDGYVDLDAHGRAGLGRHLYNALAQQIPVIGVAKKPFVDGDADWAIYRGDSERALYVTCAGVPLAQAKHDIVQMAGKHRLPILLKAVDRLCRDALPTDATQMSIE